MVLKNQKWDKIVEVFFEYPHQAFTIRELAKRTKIPPSSIQRYVERLRKEGVLTEENELITTPYIKFKKATFLIDKLFSSGLVEYLEKMLTPSAIILFGSARKGEYEHKSDIDLFIETTKRQDIDLSGFEKKIGHDIQLFVKSKISEISPELLNSVLNGIKLQGYVKVK